jgi:hypothetical protein
VRAWLTVVAAVAGVMSVPHVQSDIEKAYRAGKAAAGEDAARAHDQRGIDLARRALQATPDQPDALLWLAANLAGEALTHGKLYALRVIPEIERDLLRLEAVAPDYDHAAAARSLANLYWKAPAVISVGSSKKAAAFFELALRRAPDFPGNQAHAAAFYASMRDCARAFPLARAVAARGDLDAFGPDAAEWRQLAQQVLRDCRWSSG